MKFFLLFLMSATLLIACSDRKTTNSELYVGAYRVADRIIPYPYLIKKEKDSVFLFNESGICIDKTTNKSLKAKEELIFQKKHLKILDKKNDYLVVFDLQDTANFRRYKSGKPILKYAARLEKLTAENKVDLPLIKSEVQNFIWKYEVQEDENSNPNRDLEIEKLFHFRNDSVIIITNYFYQGLKTISEQETKVYHIFALDGIYFLSFQKESDNPQPIYRIEGYDSNKIELEDYSSRVSKSISFYKDSINIDEYEEQTKSIPSYSNCFDGYQGEYHYDDVTFNKGNAYLANYVNEGLPKSETKSGYIIIHFNISCFGNVGNFGFMQMDRDYKKTTFSKGLVKHIVNKVSELTDFPPTESQSEWLNFKDVHAFLMFKLDHGKITDVCP